MQGTQNPYLVKLEMVQSDSQKNLSDWCLTLDQNSIPSIKSFRNYADHHCTLLFARRWNHIPEVQNPSPAAGTYRVVGVTNFGSEVVLLLDDSEGKLLSRNRCLLIQCGGQEDFEIFTPHCTIAYLKPGFSSLSPEEAKIFSDRFKGKLLTFDVEKGKEFFH